MNDFFRKHLVGMVIFAIVTGFATNYLYDRAHIGLVPEQTISTSGPMIQGAGVKSDEIIYDRERALQIAKYKFEKRFHQMISDVANETSDKNNGTPLHGSSSEASRQMKMVTLEARRVHGRIILEGNLDEFMKTYGRGPTEHEIDKIVEDVIKS